jgi:hypothetical protein
MSWWNPFDQEEDPSQAAPVPAPPPSEPLDIWQFLAEKEPGLAERARVSAWQGAGGSILAPVARRLPEWREALRQGLEPGATPRPEGAESQVSREMRAGAERLRAYDERRARLGIQKPASEIAVESVAGVGGMLAADLPTFFMPAGAAARSIQVGRTVAKGLGVGRSALAAGMAETGGIFGTAELLR